MTRDGARFDLEIRPDVFMGEDLLARVEKMEVEATVDGADELRLTVAPWDADRKRWLFGPGEPLAAGSEVVAWVGYGSDLWALQAFRIEHRRAPLKAGSSPRLEIIGYSPEAKMAQNETPRSWTGPISDAQIVRELAELYGFAHDGDTIEDTPNRSTGRTKERGTTDWQFVRSLAYENGFGEPSVRWSPGARRYVFTWRQTNLRHQDEIATFRLDPEDRQRSTLLAFDGAYSLSGAPSAVEVVGWDAAKGEAVKIRVTVDQGGQQAVAYRGKAAASVDARIRSGSQLQVATLNASGEPLAERPEVLTLEGGVALRDAGAIEAWAKRYLATRNRGFLTADATTVGYERAWIGQVHRFLGLPPEFEGSYEANTVRHEFNRGAYRCRWDLRALIDELPIREEG